MSLHQLTYLYIQAQYECEKLLLRLKAHPKLHSHRNFAFVSVPDPFSLHTEVFLPFVITEGSTGWRQTAGGDVTEIDTEGG